MLFLITLAVAALSGAAIIVLIPEGLHLDGCDPALLYNNIWVCYGVTMFFVINQIIKLLMRMNDSEYVNTCEKFEDEDSIESSDQQIIQNTDSKKEKQPFIKSFKSNLKTMKPVGWLVLLADGVHNFLDGIALGYTFSDPNSQSKLTLTIAILAEEFPHELGDYAILLKSGLTPIQAIISNLLSAFFCILGYFLGAILYTYIEKQVYSWMGGVFLFISFGSMLQEVEQQIEFILLKYGNLVKIGKKGHYFELILCIGICVFGFWLGYNVVFRAGGVVEGFMPSK